MEKLDFTPAEWKEWRLKQGLPWPPISRMAFFQARYEEELERQLAEQDQWPTTPLGAC